MEGTRNGFICGVLIAAFIVTLCGTAAAQDMPPILAPLAPAPVVAPAPPSVPVSPSAEAVLPPAAEKAQVAAVPHALAAHHHAKVALAKKQPLPHHIVSGEHRVAVRPPEPALPTGMPMPPPGYYGPGPYRHLVYAGPPPGFYGGWGYRGPYPDYP
jgi:hypothetical protein